MRRALIGAGIILLLGLAVFFFVLPGLAEKRMNRVLRPSPYPASTRAVELHQRLLVADLHADSLLWNRDLLERGTRGHVDVPRLRDGNVALQGFTVVTKTPRNMNLESNRGDSDNIQLLAIAQRWPIAAWTSRTERALYQARKLHDTAARSEGRFVVIRSSSDLSRYLERRRRDPAVLAGFLGIEGAHALDGDLAAIDVLYAAGFRMMAPTHFFDNDIGGSAHGVTKGGLTDKGRDMVSRMEARRMLVDVAHASPRTIDDVLRVASRPVVVSHTGVRGTCDNARNLSDEHVRGIGRTGGIVGVGYWETATCGTDAHAIVRAIRHVTNLIGIDHVGLGSDYDGAVTVPFDTTGVVQVTEALLDAGFSEVEIGKIMGGNVVRLLLESLPP